MDAAQHGDCEHWTEHVIVFGLEGVGLRTVEQLRMAEVPVVVLDDDPDARFTVSRHHLAGADTAVSRERYGESPGP